MPRIFLAERWPGVSGPPNPMPRVFSVVLYMSCCAHEPVTFFLDARVVGSRVVRAAQRIVQAVEK